MTYYKCEKCSWVHFEYSEGNPLPDSRCFNCGHDSFEFANESDVPVGSTIQPVYKPRVLFITDDYLSF